MTVLLRRKGLLLSECVVDKDGNHCSLTAANPVLGCAARSRSASPAREGCSPQLIAAACLMKGWSTSSPFPLRAPLCSEQGLRQAGAEGAQRGWDPPTLISHPAPHQAGAVSTAAGLYCVVGALCWELLGQRNQLLPLPGIRALFQPQEGENPLKKPSRLHYLLKLEQQVARVINTWVAPVNPAQAMLLSQWL